ncbi:ATPase, T2SS/T4P/T4SS family [Alicyclobacillus acidocaldarius]|uniref:Type II secretion system protein E n=1 Tax=Alicyclobacillus acidocaldarius subsp. acidocaldarius (strain ATCC 27009 / DSM 446 / BCRC 14685 / JCM 5260 / KCTC 1825 / NBRC 15652 / NCIMB 11725 / NRRL B-14509 / 104-IA) TaxID=521098 RepID=C8WYP3_ALIAD|nr:ATPase, T2SS/T4P/T4SS family [Alicyclobacillus acidocaldarius]ACV60137.1 type II secretion system protein E [Alicyclobacillus acidocaldarius subsp. acidocaldarius DSM 446]
MRPSVDDAPRRALNLNVASIESYKRALLQELSRETDFLSQVPDRTAMAWQLATLSRRVNIPTEVQRTVIDAILADVYDYSILTELKARPKVTTIWVAGDRWVEYREGGVIKRWHRRFENLEDVYRFIEHKLTGTPFRYARNVPEIDAILSDGSRFHVKQGPCGITVEAGEGRRVVQTLPLITIRQFVYPYPLRELVKDPWLYKYLSLLPLLGESLLVTGAQESGKTTMLNALTAFLPPCRLIIIEEAPEMQPQHPDTIRLWSRGVVGTQGYVSMAQNLKASLRMTGDAMLVGEVRDPEVLWIFLEMANLGLIWVATTLHASSAEDALLRVRMLGISAPPRPAEDTVAYQLARGITHVIHLERNGEYRGVVEVREITGFENGRILSRPVFVRDARTGDFIFHGVSERFKAKALAQGVSLEGLA